MAAKVSFGATFLRFPDLFPARCGGEPWGEEGLSLSFGGSRYDFSGLSLGQAAVLSERFSPLLDPAAEAREGAFPVAVFRASSFDFLHPDLKGWRNRLDLDPEASLLRVAGLSLLARLEWEPPGRAALWTDLEQGAELEGVFENLFRVLAAYRVLAAGGVLLHSAGIASGDGAYLFFGPSGAGKTTVSRLSAASGRRVLSDELNALYPQEGGTVVERLPFAGDFGRQPGGPREILPLCGLFRLEQGPSHRLLPLAPAAAVAQLAACAPFVNADPHRTGLLLANLERLVRNARPATLAFSRDAGFWSIVEAHLP